MVTILTIINTKGFALMQCTAISFAMLHLIKSRRSKTKTIILLIISTVTAFTLLQTKLEMIPIIKLLIINFTVIGVWCICFNKYIAETIFFSIIVFYELMLCDLISGNAIALLTQNRVDKIIYGELQEVNTQLTYLLFSSASFLFFCLCLYFTVKYFSTKRLLIVNKYWISVDFILSFCYVISLLFMNLNVQVSTQGMTMGALLVWGGFAVIAILVVKLFTNLCYHFQTENERMMIIINNKALEEQLHLQTSAIQEMRVFRHDISNHIDSVCYLLKNNCVAKARDYLEDISIKISNQKFVTYCANDTINAVLNLIRIKCEETDIVFNVCIESDYNINISSIDITAILFNLLNNSVEAVSKSKALEKRTIHVQIGKFNAYDCFLVENTYDKIMQATDGTFITTKADANIHGYGIKSVKETAQKYGGKLHINISNNSFKTTVLLLTK